MCISHSPEQTQELGRSWGEQAQPGLVIGLSGDLGAGKTQLAKGIARGLGITARVQSPSFALIHVYTGGRLDLYHIDLYRLETREQIIAAGLEDYLQPRGVTVVEWIERWVEGETGSKLKLSRLAKRVRWVRIEAVSETERRISYEDFGA